MLAWTEGTLILVVLLMIGQLIYYFIDGFLFLGLLYQDFLGEILGKDWTDCLTRRVGLLGLLPLHFLSLPSVFLCPFEAFLFLRFLEVLSLSDCHNDQFALLQKPFNLIPNFLTAILFQHNLSQLILQLLLDLLVEVLLKPDESCEPFHDILKEILREDVESDQLPVYPKREGEERFVLLHVLSVKLLSRQEEIQFNTTSIIIISPEKEEGGSCERRECVNIFIVYSKQVMGNGESNTGGETFQAEDWEMVDSFDLLRVWRSRRDPTQRLQQHTIYSSSDEQHKQEKQMYHFRKNHPTIVASRYFITESKNQLCSSSHVQRLFLEKIPIRLSDVEHIPFPDFLHIFHQSLRGFYDLARQVGFFAVEEEYIGINEKGVVKVWMNQNYAKNYYNGGKVSQEFMVNSIVEIIERNIDHSRIPKEIPTVRNYLYRNTDRLRFEQAIIEFNQFMQQYLQSNVPTRLACIDQVGGIDAIANREKPHETEESQLTIRREYEAQRDSSRPQLIDSEILKNAFQATSPRIETSPSYYQVGRSTPFKGSQVVPNMQHNILTPSNVRENTPIVRKQTATFHVTNGFNPYSQQTVFQVPIQIKPFEKKQSGQENGPNVQPRSNSITYQVAERPESKSFGASNLPQQVKAITIVPQQINKNSQVIVQQKRSQEITLPNPSMSVKASIIDLVQPETPKSDSIRIRSFDSSNVAFFNPQPNPTKFVVPPIAIPAPSVPIYQQQEAPRSARIPSDRQASNPVSTENLDFKKSDSYGKNSYFSNFNQRSAFIQTPQPNPIPTITKSSNEFNAQPLQKSPYSNINNDQLGGYKASTFSNFPNVNSNNVKQSQYTSIDIQDGKSSDDFLKKLKEFKTSKDDFQFFQPSAPIEPTYQRDQYSYFNDSKATDPVLKQVSSVENINNEYSAQDFGRNAVSNIIQNQSGEIPSQKYTDNTPLKFENNLDMKYSMFQADDPVPEPYQPSYLSRKYESNLDADILADLNNLRG